LPADESYDELCRAAGEMRAENNVGNSLRFTFIIFGKRLSLNEIPRRIEYSANDEAGAVDAGEDAERNG